MAGGSEDSSRGDNATEDDGPLSGDWPENLDSDVLELEYVFEALYHPRRRYLMYALASNSEWTLRELATKLTAWEQDVDETDVDETARDRKYVSLYHNHVPKLVDLGVVEFDSDAETIARGEHATQVFGALHGVGESLDRRQEEHADRPYDSEVGEDE